MFTTHEKNHVMGTVNGIVLMSSVFLWLFYWCCWNKY